MIDFNIVETRRIVCHIENLAYFLSKRSCTDLFEQNPRTIEAQIYGPDSIALANEL